MSVFNRPDQPLIDAFSRAVAIRARAAVIKDWADTPFRFTREGQLFELTVGASRALTLFGRWAAGEGDILFEEQDFYRSVLIVPMSHLEVGGDWALVLAASNVPGLTSSSRWELRKECGFTGRATALADTTLDDDEDAFLWGEMAAVAAGYDLTASYTPIETTNAFASLVA